MTLAIWGGCNPRPLNLPMCTYATVAFSVFIPSHRHKNQGKCPHSQSHTCSCYNWPDYEIAYKISRISSYKVCSDQLNLVATTKKLLPQHWPSSISSAKWAWSKICRVRSDLMPPNFQHLPTPVQAVVVKKRLHSYYVHMH